MVDPLNSLNEPLFYLHHGAIDYYWSIWQEQDLKNNIYDLDASSKRSLGEKAWAVRVEMGAFAPPRTVKEVADPENRDGTGALCFRYEGPAAKDYLSESPPKAPKAPWLVAS
jgi:tyrosinase